MTPLPITIHPDTRSRINEVALRLFAQQGFAATGIRQIADGVGISAASLYHYMGTKEDLLERLMSTSILELLRPATAIASKNFEPVERIHYLVKLHVEKHGQDNVLCFTGDTELHSLPTDARLRIVTLRDQYEAIWTSAVAEGVEAGAFTVPDTRLAVIALLEMCSGVASWYRPGGRLSLPEIISAYEQLALNMLGKKLD